MILLGIVLYFGGIWYLMLRLAVAVIRRYRKMVLWDMKGWFIPMDLGDWMKGMDQVWEEAGLTPMTGPAWGHAWEQAGAIAWPAPSGEPVELPWAEWASLR